MNSVFRKSAVPILTEDPPVNPLSPIQIEKEREILSFPKEIISSDIKKYTKRLNWFESWMLSRELKAIRPLLIKGDNFHCEINKFTLCRVLTVLKNAGWDVRLTPGVFSVENFHGIFKESDDMFLFTFLVTGRMIQIM
jgi:hypothetical protein